MAFYDNLKKANEIIEFLKTNKNFEELYIGYRVWVLDIKTLEIKSCEIEKITISEFKVNDCNLQQHSFNMVDISLKESIKGFRIIGNTNLGHDSQRVVCTSRKVIELIKEILMAKCNIQMKGFKELFHYEGWDYDKAPWHN